MSAKGGWPLRVWFSFAGNHCIHSPTGGETSDIIDRVVGRVMLMFEKRIRRDRRVRADVRRAGIDMANGARELRREIWARNKRIFFLFCWIFIRLNKKCFGLRVWVPVN